MEKGASIGEGDELGEGVRSFRAADEGGVADLIHDGGAWRHTGPRW